MPFKICVPNKKEVNSSNKQKLAFAAVALITLLSMPFPSLHLQPSTGNFPALRMWHCRHFHYFHVHLAVHGHRQWRKRMRRRRKPWRMRTVNALCLMGRQPLEVEEEEHIAERDKMPHSNNSILFFAFKYFLPSKAFSHRPPFSLNSVVLCCCAIWCHR